MNKRDENMEWELEAPRLANLSRKTPYCVPENYFDDLSSNITSSIFLENLTIHKQGGFNIPKNYFNGLSQDIETRIAVKNIKELINKDGLNTPTNYFDELSSKILSRTTNESKKGRVLKLWQTDFFKYAAAACFIFLTATGLYFNKQTTVKQNLNTELASEQMLYDIDENVIIEHLQESQAVIGTSTTTTTSDTEMERYILNHFSSNDISSNL